MASAEEVERTIVCTFLDGSLETDTETSTVYEACVNGIFDAFEAASRSTRGRRELEPRVSRFAARMLSKKGSKERVPKEWLLAQEVVVGAAEMISRLSPEEFLEGFLTVKRPPSIATSEIPWKELACAQGLKQFLLEAIILPKKFPQLFTGLRRPWRTILLFGPSGCGRSTIVSSIAVEANTTLLVADMAALMSPWIGEGERMVHSLFKLALSIGGGAILNINEIDSLSRQDGESECSRRLMTEMLIQLDCSGRNQTTSLSIVIESSRPWELSGSVLRRTERRVYVELPKEAARLQVLKRSLQPIPNTVTDVDLEMLVKSTEGFSHAEIAQIIQASWKICSQPSQPSSLGVDEILAVVKRTTRSTTPADLERYQRWAEAYC